MYTICLSKSRISYVKHRGALVNALLLFMLRVWNTDIDAWTALDFSSVTVRRFRMEKFRARLTRILPSRHSNLINLSQGQKHIHFGKNIHSRLRSYLENEIRQSLKN